MNCTRCKTAIKKGEHYRRTKIGPHHCICPRVFTPRGFEDFCEFRDTNGSLVSVRESSIATDFCVWIFCKDNPRMDDPAPHLNVEQAQQVIDALTAFVRRREAQP